MTQKEKILICLLKNPNKVFTAIDFQSGNYFVGYEASARISELIDLFPELFLVGKKNKFRTIQLNTNAIEEINELINGFKEVGLWEN